MPRKFPRAHRVSAIIAAAALAAPAPLWGANSELDVNNGATDLTSAASYRQNTAPTTTSDVTFDAGMTYNPTAFTINSNLSIGTLDDLDATQSLSISNASSAADTLTLDGGTNSVSGTAGDLLYVAAGGNLTINGGSGSNALGIVLGASGNFDIAGTASISSVMSGSNGFTLTGGGTLTLGGLNTYTGLTTLKSGTLVLSGGNNTLLSGTEIDFTGTTILNLGGFAQSAKLEAASGIAETITNGTLNLTASDFDTSGAIFSGNLTLTSTATVNAPSTSKLDIREGATVTSSGTINANGVSNAIAMIVGDGQNGILNITGGTVTVAKGEAATTAQLAIGDGTTTTGTITVSGGTLTLASDQIFDIGGYTNAHPGTGILNINGTGLVSVYSGGSNSTLSMGGGSGSNATINLGNYSTSGAYGGTISMGRSFGYIASSTATLNFNGGTFQATANISSLIASGITANVLNGGLTMDVNGFSVGIAQPLKGTGTGGLTLNSTAGGGTLTLSAASTYTGPTLINGGLLVANTASGGSATGTGNVTVNSGGALAGGSAATPGYIVASSGNAVTINSGGTISAGNGIISSSTPGLLDTTGGNGSTTFSQVWNAGGQYDWKVKPTATTGPLTPVNGVGTTESQSSGTVSAGTNWDTLLMGSLDIPSTFTITVVPLSGTLNGGSYSWSIADITSGNVDVDGTLYNTSTVSGLQAALQADLRLANGGTLNSAEQYTIGAAFDGTSGVDILINAVPTQNGELDVRNGAVDLTVASSYVQNTAPTSLSDVTFVSGVTYNPNAFTVNSNVNMGTLNDNDGTQTLSISNTGGSAVTLTLNGGSNTVSSNPQDILYVAPGGTLNINGGSGSATLGLVLNANGNFDIAGNSNISAVVSGPGGLTLTGGGTLTLSAQNTYAGATTLNGGTLVLAGGNNTILPSGLFNFTATSTLNLGGSTQSITEMKATAGVTATITNGAITETSTADFNIGFYGTLNLTSTATLNTPAGKFDILGGATVDTAGTINAVSSSSSGGYAMLVGDNTNGTLNVTGGSVIVAAGDAASTESLDVGPGSTGIINVSGGTFSMASDQSIEIGGRNNGVPGIGTINVNGAGVFSVYTGTSNTTIGLGGGASSAANSVNINIGNYSTSGTDGGTFSTGRSFAVISGTPTGTAAINFDGGTFQATGNISSLVGAGIGVNILNGGATFDVNGHTVGIAQPLAAANGSTGGLTLVSTAGGGSLALSAANTYTGPTIINGGTLLANTASTVGSSTGSGSVTVNSGGALAGGSAATPGYISASSGNAVTINSGGMISAGNGITATSTTGVLNTAGGDGNSTFSQVWNSGGTYLWKVKSSATTGSAASQVNGVGTTENQSSGTVSPGTNWDTLVMQSLDIPSTFNISVLSLNGGVLSSGGYTYSIADVTSGNIDIDGTAYNNSNYSAVQTALQTYVTLSNTSSLSPTERFSLGAIYDGEVGTDIVIYAVPQNNSELDVKNGGVDLTVAPSYVQNTAPNSASDVTFMPITYSPTSFTINSNLTMGTLNDKDATQTLTIANTGTAASTLTLDGGSNTVSSSAGDLLYVAAGGTLNINGGSSPNTLALALPVPGNLDIAGTANISAVISGGNGLTLTGGGTLKLGAIETYTGTTTLKGGTLVLAGGTNTIPTTGSIAFAANSTLDLGTNSQTIAGFYGATGVTATLTDGSLTLSTQTNGTDFNNTFTGTLNLTSSATLNTPGGKFDVRGGSTVNTAGTINADGSGTNYSMLVGDGTNGTFNMTGGTVTLAAGEAVNVAQLAIGGASTGVVNITGGTFSVASDQTVDIGGRSSGSPGNGTLTVAGSGVFSVYNGTTNTTIILGGGSTSNPGSANLNIGNYSSSGAYGGTLSTGRSFALAASTPSGTATINFDGGTFQATGNIPSLIPAYIQTNVLNGGATFDVNGYSVGIAQPLNASGTGGLTEVSTAGGGSLLLSANNTYTGPTLINAGMLLANTPVGGSATGSGNVTVDSGAILAGGSAATPGYINSSSGNAVTVQNGATISAGNGITSTSTTGVLNTTGGDGNSTFAQVWNSGGAYAWKVKASAATSNTVTQVNGIGTTESQSSGSVSAGTNWDTLVMSSLSIPSAFTISVVSLNGGLLASGNYIYSIADVTSGNVNVDGTAYNDSNLGGLQTALQTYVTLNNTSSLSPTERFSLGAIYDGSGGADIVIYGIPQSNSELDVKNGASNMTVAPSYVQNTAPNTASDVTFMGGVTYNPASFTVNSNLTMGTLNDKDATQTLNISNTGTTASTLTLDGGSNTVSSSAGDLLYVAAGGTLNINGGSSPNTLALALPVPGNLDIAGTANISAVISGGNGLTLTGGGTLKLSAINTYTGATILNGGTLILAGGTNTIPVANSVNFTGNSTLDLGGNSQTLAGLQGSTGVNATLTDGTLTLTTQTNGSDFYESFYGTLNLSSTATLTAAGGKLDVRQGGTLNTAGTINANSTGNGYAMLIADGSNGTFNMTGGTVTVAAGEAATTSAFSIGGAATGVATITGGAFSVASDQIVDIGGRNSGAPGTGTLTVAGSGVFSVFNGTTNTTILLGGGSGSTSGSANVNIGNYSSSGSYGGTISTGRSFALAASTPSNTATISFDGGTFQATGNIPSLIGSSINANVLNGGATFDVNGYNVGIAQPLNGSGSGGLTLISTAGGGSLALSAANTYSGPTIINGGTLLANSPSSSGSSTGNGNVTINSGGALAGGSAATPGYIAASLGNAVTVQKGGAISAGTGINAASTPGALSTNGGDGNSTFAQVWNSDGQYAWKVRPSASTSSTVIQVNNVGTTESQSSGSVPAGTNWDTLVMTSLSIPSTFTINVVPVTSGGTFSPGSSYSWSIADVTSGNVNVGGTTYTTGMIASLQPALQSAVSLGNTSSLSSSGKFSLGVESDGNSGDDIVINYSPAPEPTSLALLALGAGGLMLRRRRRQAPNQA